MKLRVLTLLGVLALGAGTVIHAQDYDDIYYDGSKQTTEVKRETKRVETQTTRTEVPTRYKVTVEKNYQTERDVDEYNRRGGIYAQPENDTLYLDAPDYESQSTFGNTKRIERFYNPDIVVLSNDDELVELYYDTAPTINLVIGTNYGFSPRFGWGIGYSTYWYDPWYGLYDPFFDPWYYSGWYGWHRPYYRWGGWYYAGWGWSRPWHYTGWYGYGWGHHWGGGYWGGGYYSGNHGRWHGHSGDRLPGDHRSLLNGSSRRGGGLTTGSRAGVRTAGNSGRMGGGTITNGRTRPSTMSGVTTGRTRPSSQIGNIDRTTRGAATGGYSGGSVRNRGTASSGYSGSTTRSYSPSSSSRSSGYSGSRSSSYGSSRSSSYGGSRSGSYGSSRSSGGYSGGGFSGGGRSSGGFGGGGSSRSGGGGGGGGRRH